VIALPQGAAGGLRECVRDWIEADRALEWCVFEAGSTSASPVRQLLDRFDPDHSRGRLATLSQSDRFAYRALWIEGLDEANWEDWRQFLTDYEHAGRSRDPPARSVFCVPVPGSWEAALPAENASLAHRPWRARISRLDMQLYLAVLLGGRAILPLHQELIIGVGAELAGEDPELARRLAAAELAAVLEPRSLLAEYARANGWDREPGWVDGTAYVRDGKEQPHSALADGRTLARRVWRGQVGVLWGHLEEERLAIARQFRGRLKTPFETEFGTIDDPEHLEVQHVHYLLARDRSVPHSIRRRLRILRDMRNCLAHLEPVPASLLAQLHTAR